MNQVNIIGFIGQDAAIRTIKNGNKMANISVATNESWQDKQGQWHKRTEWHRVVAFGDIATKYHLTKGQKVSITGRLRTRQYEQAGIKRSVTEIVAMRIELLKHTTKEAA